MASFKFKASDLPFPPSSFTPLPPPFPSPSMTRLHYSPSFLLSLRPPVRPSVVAGVTVRPHRSPSPKPSYPRSSPRRSPPRSPPATHLSPPPGFCKSRPSRIARGPDMKRNFSRRRAARGAAMNVPVQKPQERVQQRPIVQLPDILIDDCFPTTEPLEPDIPEEDLDDALGDDVVRYFEHIKKLTMDMGAVHLPEPEVQCVTETRQTRKQTALGGELERWFQEIASEKAAL